MPDLVKDKVAVVTGGGNGLGRAHCLALAAQGAKVVVADIGADTDGFGQTTGPADEVVDEIRKGGGEAVASYESVAIPERAERIIKTALDNFGRIDILVNNAGFDRQAPVDEQTLENWDAVVKVNLYGMFYCTHYAVPHMKKGGYGRIINTASHIGLGESGVSAYGAAKEGIIGFTRCLAHELGSFGITCNALRPAAGTRPLMAESTQQFFAATFGEKKAYDFGRLMTEVYAPEGVSPLVVYLASENADNVNGCIFEVWTGHIGIYHDPPGIEQLLVKDGSFVPDELVNLMPNTLTEGKVRQLTPPFHGPMKHLK